MRHRRKRPRAAQGLFHFDLEEVLDVVGVVSWKRNKWSTLKGRRVAGLSITMTIASENEREGWKLEYKCIRAEWRGVLSFDGLSLDGVWLGGSS